MSKRGMNRLGKSRFLSERKFAHHHVLAAWQSLAIFCLFLFSHACSANALPIDYWCGELPGMATASNKAVASEPAPVNIQSISWQSAVDGSMRLNPQYAHCWIRLQQVPRAPQQLVISNGWANVDLFDAEFHLIAKGERILEQSPESALNNQVSRSSPDYAAGVLSLNHMIFAVDPAWRLPLYVRIATRSGGLIIPNGVQVESAEVAQLMEQNRQQSNISLAVAVAVLLTAFVCLAFGITLKDTAYAWMSAYLFLSVVIRVFNPFEPLIFSLTAQFDLARLVSRLMYPIINAVWMLAYARIADFAHFAPRLNRLAKWTAVLFLLEIPLWLLDAPLGQSINFSLILFLTYPVLFCGCWIAWRGGNRSAGILLLSNCMLFIFWAPYQLFGLWPIPLFAKFIVSESLSSLFGVTSDLVLPLLFCIALALRTLELKQAAVRLMSYDALTGLANREMIRRLGEAMLKQGQSLAVLVLNIDRFRAINATLGPQIGDQLLVVAGNRLSALSGVLSGAQVGRLHADQFCLLWPDINSIPQLKQSIERDFAQPIDEHGQLVDLSLSVGIASTDDTDQSQKDGKLDMAQLLRRAELALESARQQHQQWMHYHPDFERARRADLGLLSELNRAVEQGELRMFLQPKFNFASGRVDSAEALVRWQHPQRGLVGPIEFVPFAEQTGRIVLITQWIFVSAMRLSADLRAQGSALQISVNVSAVDLNKPGFVADLQNLCAELGAQASDIRIEVTESAAMHDPNAALQIMHALRDVGFSLSIDDFGTGYSSLAYLQKMPVAELKIDRSFVRDVVAGSDAAVLLESTIVMAHRLGLSVVAEGAETAIEWNLLKDLQCDYVQGYYLAKPMPVEEFLRWRAAPILLK
ncbi:putative bifunctional diguanylate cyclase/phosphodiesterase [Undibacterium flavidum]|uniref:EAL domain-containing protein n=1 Tax=Undibacterium flavidum TaxID=2762297 RepID=A0ABR6YDQ8_9BURK|nr:EAL domain-containing protein [Undibacterium flavidum]MBC3874680.1 EAL domain-containing protein [Undibacterium flavidum]